jgi:protein SCO1/2
VPTAPIFDGRSVDLYPTGSPGEIKELRMSLSGSIQKRPSDGQKMPAATSRNWLAYVAIAVGILFVGVAAYVLAVVRPGQALTLTGGIIDPPFVAPDFKLTDQFGQPVALSSFTGKVVVLTFLYTNCPDACPLITAKLHQAYQQLGPDTSRLAILAVTVDPARDTTAQVRSYSVQKDMLDKWHFLVGAETELQPVWSAYGIEAVSADALAVQDQATAVALNAATPTPPPVAGTVSHTSPLFLIDRSGKVRAILDIDFAPSDLVQDVRALLQ